MKTLLIQLTVTLMLFSLPFKGWAQKKLAAFNIEEIHVVNGMGWGFPTGQTREVLSPKYSTSLGLDITMKDKNLFLYPALDFLAFKYKQLKSDIQSDFLIENATNFFYQLNLMAGAKKKLGNFKLYTYGGPVMGFVTEPKARLLNTGSIKLKNQYDFTGGLRLGGGSEYKLGTVYLFFELSYLHNLSTMQGKNIHVLTGYGGLKTNITRVADKVIEIITEPAKTP
jgi:hypothetical protein